MSTRHSLLTFALGCLVGTLAVLGVEYGLYAVHRHDGGIPLDQHMWVAPPAHTVAVASRATALTPKAPPTTGPTTAPDWHANPPTPEQVMYLQPQLMQQALARLRPQRPHKVDLYLITFAGDGNENVFRNEAEYAARLFAQRFDAKGHTLVLENNPATAATTPLADWSNLEIALSGMHKVMDPKQDILMLYLTSHGGEDHSLLVDLDPLPLDPIYADDLAGILREHHFPWKVVVVNACYSGGFIPPLQGAGTLIMTAASADRSSFGCGSESKITYFGDAWLARALNHDGNLVDAFNDARSTIAQWEKAGGLAPSHPQISVGAGIAGQLQAWRSGFTPGNAVPFLAARPAQSMRKPDNLKRAESASR